ncbi:hypothetical protein [Nocardia arthritidis]|uniref:Uncharacterized protein n=1 Tax=Nocardia arthritidis TaxID=228602 RepID=A0A6G9YLP9_9NOCA|nr:hypothetical protein [Nocardia arthritidis]QIS14225.1 hypothetical protein F5544_31930 [Nocardia arthritidis]
MDDVGGALSSAAKAVAPVVAKAAGGAVSGAAAGASLGPWGMLGGALLGGATSALSGGAAPASAAPVSARPRPARRRRAPRPTDASLPALIQLLGALGSPTTQQALGSMLLGNIGSPTLPTAAGTSVPVAAITNLLSLLANRASVESETIAPYEGEDYVGAAFDRASPEVRAELLYAQLLPVEVNGSYTDDVDESWLDEVYDEAEAAFYADPPFESY